MRAIKSQSRFGPHLEHFGESLCCVLSYSFSNISKHRNVAAFFGLLEESENGWPVYYFLQEYGHRGSLQDVLGNVQLTWQGMVILQ